MDAVVGTFASSLENHDIDLVETTTGAAPETLGALLDPPVVGAPLDEVGVSLQDLPVTVTTDPSFEDLFEARTGLTPAVSAIAEYGSVVLQGTENGEEPLSLYPETHVAVVAESDIHEDMAAAIGDVAEHIRAGEKSHIVATGPSATADMGELVKGAHGPKDVEIVVVTDR
ncbi:MAG: LUD domain-containing protein [Halanaeroarchaeum sp.]